MRHPRGVTRTRVRAGRASTALPWYVGTGNPCGTRGATCTHVPQVRAQRGVCLGHTQRCTRAAARAVAYVQARAQRGRERDGVVTVPQAEARAVRSSATRRRCATCVHVAGCVCASGAAPSSDTILCWG